MPLLAHLHGLVTASAHLSHALADVQWRTSLQPGSSAWWYKLLCNLYGGAHVTLESIAFATSGSSLIVIHTQRHRPRVCHNWFQEAKPRERCDCGVHTAETCGLYEGAIRRSKMACVYQGFRFVLAIDYVRGNIR